MRVHDRLSRDLSIVDADVEAIGVELLFQEALQIPDDMGTGFLFPPHEFEDALDVAVGDDQAVPFADRIGVVDSESIILFEEERTVQVAEGAGG